MTRKPYTTIWRVYLSAADPEIEDDEVLFTTERSGAVFARWAMRHWAVVVGPSQVGVYRSGAFAIRREAENIPPEVTE